MFPLRTLRGIGMHRCRKTTSGDRLVTGRRNAYFYLMQLHPTLCHNNLMQTITIQSKKVVAARAGTKAEFETIGHQLWDDVSHDTIFRLNDFRAKYAEAYLSPTPKKVGDMMLSRLWLANAARLGGRTAAKARCAIQSHRFGVEHVVNNINHAYIVGAERGHELADRLASTGSLWSNPQP